MALARNAMTSIWNFVCVGLLLVSWSTAIKAEVTLNITVTENSKEIFSISLSGDNLEKFYEALCSSKSYSVIVGQDGKTTTSDLDDLDKSNSYFQCSFNDQFNTTKVECIHQYESYSNNLSENCTSINLVQETCDQQPVRLIWEETRTYSLTSSNDDILVLSDCKQSQPSSTIQRPTTSLSTTSPASSISPVLAGRDSSNSDDDENSLPIIIAVVVIGLVVLVIAIILIFMIIKLRNILNKFQTTYREDIGDNTHRSTTEYENELGDLSSPRRCHDDNNHVSNDYENELD